VGVPVPVELVNVALPLSCNVPVFVTLPAKPPPPLAAALTVIVPEFVSVLLRTSMSGALPTQPPIGQSSVTVPPFVNPAAEVATVLELSALIVRNWPALLVPLRLAPASISTWLEPLPLYLRKPQCSM